MSKLKFLAPLALCALIVPGCFLIPNEVEAPKGDADVQKEQKDKIKEAKAFSHQLWNEVLQTHNKGGFVDYKAISKDKKKLENYIALLKEYSPNKSKELFPTRDDELAYWINAYNALCFQNVLRRYKEGFDSILPDQKAFFYSDRFELGGEFTSLFALENELVRPTYKDPRVHFALNCASYSCPRLPETAFEGSTLEDRLEEETRKFLNEERNVSFDVGSGKLIVSKLFEWYKDDFLDWPAFPEVKNAESDTAKIIGYINHYRADADKIPDRKDGWDLETRDYNWLLNEQGNESGVN